MNIDQSVALEWLEARNVIKEFLRELVPSLTEAQLDHNAAAVIARLAHANFLLEKVSGA